MKSRSPSRAWKSICGLAKERVERLEEQRENVQARLVHLATIRAQYSNLVATARHRGEILKTAQQELAEARAGQAGAHTASLITLIGGPEVGSRPVGPGKTIILLGGMLGGLLMGAGIIFLTVKPEPRARRASSDPTPIASGAIETAAAKTAVIEPVATEAFPRETAPVENIAADCCSVGPGPTGCSAGRSSASRSAPIWVADPPTLSENSVSVAGTIRRRPGRGRHASDFVRAKIAGGGRKPIAAASARSRLSAARRPDH